MFSVLSSSGDVGNSPNHFGDALLSSQKKMETSSLVKIYLIITKEQQGQMGAESCLMTRSIISKQTCQLPSGNKDVCLTLYEAHIFSACAFPKMCDLIGYNFKKPDFFVSFKYLKIIHPLEEKNYTSLMLAPVIYEYIFVRHNC